MSCIKLLLIKLLFISVLTITVFACSTTQTESKAPAILVNSPRSILVLEPLNTSNDIKASYSYLSTISKPLAAAGYYVFPVAVMDTYLKENGLIDAHAMRQVPLSKYKEILDADAVLFITIDRYGQEYNLLNSQTIVSAKAALVLTDTEEVFWSGSTTVSNSSDSGDSLGETLFNAVFTQIVSANRNNAHKLSKDANWRLIHGHRGLPDGPRKTCFHGYCRDGATSVETSN